MLFSQGFLIFLSAFFFQKKRSVQEDSATRRKVIVNCFPKIESWAGDLSNGKMWLPTVQAEYFVSGCRSILVQTEFSEIGLESSQHKLRARAAWQVDGHIN